MWKILRHGVSVVCLLLAIIAGGLWFRSYNVEDTIGIHADDSWFETWSISTSIGLVFIYGDELDWPRKYPYISYVSSPLNKREGVTWFGGTCSFRFNTAYSLLSIFDGPSYTKRFVAVSRPWGFAVIFPIWLAIVVFLIFPLCDGLLLLRKRLRRSITICPKCHYDLRASATTCPECGTPIQPLASKAS